MFSTYILRRVFYISEALHTYTTFNKIKYLNITNFICSDTKKCIFAAHFNLHNTIMIITKEKKEDILERLDILYKELITSLDGEDLSAVPTTLRNGEEKVKLGNKEYNKTDLIDLDIKKLNASISRLETELSILKKI